MVKKKLKTMASPSKQASAPTQRRPRVRKSIAHVPSSDTAQDQENAAQQRVKSSNPTAAPNVKSKKSRSKSLGPGLDPLHEITGNRRKSVSSFVPKSILKPSIPLSPIREIPARKASPKRNGDSPRKRAITPNGESGPDTSSRKASPGAFSQEHLNDEKEQENSQHNNAEDAEAAKRRQRKEEIQKQREARRKSMGKYTIGLLLRLITNTSKLVVVYHLRQRLHSILGIPKYFKIPRPQQDQPTQLGGHHLSLKLIILTTKDLKLPLKISSKMLQNLYLNTNATHIRSDAVEAPGLRQ